MPPRATAAAAEPARRGWWRAGVERAQQHAPYLAASFLSVAMNEHHSCSHSHHTPACSCACACHHSKHARRGGPVRDGGDEFSPCGAERVGVWSGGVAETSSRALSLLFERPLSHTMARVLVCFCVWNEKRNTLLALLAVDGSWSSYLALMLRPPKATASGRLPPPHRGEDPVAAAIAADTAKADDAGLSFVQMLDGSLIAALEAASSGWSMPTSCERARWSRRRRGRSWRRVSVGPASASSSRAPTRPPR